MEDCVSEFAERDHQLFRSHFLAADALADQTEPSEAAESRTDDSRVERVEKEIDGGWLNVRVGDGEWASVHGGARLRTDRTQQGRIADAPPPTEWSERPSYSDPVADGMDPTAPDSPESCF
jgi:hypothetical protein